MIEVHGRKHNAKLAAQFQHQPQQSRRICSTRNRDPNAIASPQQFRTANVIEQLGRQCRHGKHSTW